MTYVKLNQNNSGGSFWLNSRQFDALLADGWAPVEDYRGLRWGREAANMALDVPVDDPQHAVTIAKIEFGRVTGEDPDDIGCTCCGPPFRFEAIEYDAEYPQEYLEVERALMPTAEAVEIDEPLLLESGE